MKYTVILTSALVLASCQQMPKRETINAKEAKALLDKWNQAYYDKDTTSLNQVLHADYVYSGADGSQSAKADVMNELAISDYRIFKTDFYDLDIRTYQNTAVVRGWESLWLRSDSGDTSNVELRFIDIYIKENESVQAIATQTFPKE